MLSASSNDMTVSWHENDGDQSFTEHIITSTADGAYDVFAADVVGSGSLEVLLASYSGRTIALYVNDGSESFFEHVITDVAYGAASVVAAPPRVVNQTC